MTEKLWDVEITVAGDPSKLRSATTSIEDAIERARLASLVPVDRSSAEITIKLMPRPIP